jgi:hypothetical protein
MFDWAAHTKRGMLIFIDEAVSFYMFWRSAFTPLTAPLSP